MKDVLVLSQENQVEEKMDNNVSASDSSNSSTFSYVERQESEVEEPLNKRIMMLNALFVNNGLFSGNFDPHNFYFLSINVWLHKMGYQMQKKAPPAQTQLETVLFL